MVRSNVIISSLVLLCVDSSRGVTAPEQDFESYGANARTRILEKTPVPDGPKVVSYIVPVTKLRTGYDAPKHMEFEMEASNLGFRGTFRNLKEDSLVPLLVDTSSGLSWLDKSLQTQWPDVLDFKAPLTIGFGDGSLAVATSSVEATVWDLNMDDTFVFGFSQGRRALPMSGVFSIGPNGPFGKYMFALFAKSSDKMMYTDDVYKIHERCADSKIVSTALDVGALERDLFVTAGSMRVGSKRHETKFVFSSGKEGIDLPKALYDEFVNKAEGMRVPREGKGENFMDLHANFCAHPEVYAHQFPRISVTLRDEADPKKTISIRLALKDYVTRIGSRCVLPIRLAKDETQLAFGPAFLRRAVTLFDATNKSIRICHPLI